AAQGRPGAGRRAAPPGAGRGLCRPRAAGGERPRRPRGPGGVGRAGPFEGPDRAAALLQRADDGRDGRSPRPAGADAGPAVALRPGLAAEAAQLSRDARARVPMSEPEPRRVEELFDQAIDLDPTRLAAFLDEQCAGDADLRTAVEELLQFDRRAE